MVRERNKQVVVTSLCAMAVGVSLLFLLGVLNHGVIYRIQNKIEDVLLSSFYKEEPDPRILIVEIDDDSLTAQKELWPWHRGRIASLVKAVAQGRPSVIGIDLLFLTSDSVRPDGDEAFSQTLKETKRVVLLNKLTFSDDGSSEHKVTEPISLLKKNTVSGFYNFSPDSDQVMRRQRLGFPQPDSDDKMIPSFAYRVYREYLDASQKPLPMSQAAVLRFPYVGASGSFPRVSSHAVLEKKIPSELFQGRIVLIGATFSDAKDLFLTPMQTPSGSHEMQGIEIHANILQALLNHKSIRDVKPTAGAICGLMVIILGVFSAHWFSRKKSLLFLLSLAVGTLLLHGFLLTKYLVSLPLIPLLLSCGLGLLLVWFKPAVIRLMERRQLKNHLHILVTPDSLSHSTENKSPNEANVSQTITLLIIDVPHFKDIAESLIARGLTRQLSAYLDGVNTIVRSHGGTLNEDISKGLIGVFGLNPSQIDHGRQGCSAALELIRATNELKEHWQKEMGIAFYSEVGIHTTLIQLSHAVQNGRSQITLTGEEIHVAQRLAKTASQFGTQILVSEDTVRLLTESYQVKPVGSLRMRGEKKRMEILSLVSYGTKSRVESSTRSLKQSGGNNA